MAKILIIEDDLFLLDAYKVRLGQSQWKVVTANDGEDGFERAVTSKPDLIILDLLLPGISGYEVLKRLKKNTVTKAIPVVVASNVDQEKAKAEAKKLGAVDYFVKSDVSIDDFYAICKRYLP